MDKSNNPVTREINRAFTVGFAAGVFVGGILTIMLFSAMGG